MAPQRTHRHIHNPIQHQCDQCGRTVRSLSALTKHKHSFHLERPIPLPSHVVTPPRVVQAQGPHDPPMDGLPLEPEPSDFVDEGLYRNYHPKLTGKYRSILQFFIRLSHIITSVGRPCDQDGKFLDPATPPPPRTQASRHDWTPYADRIQFDTAEFLYQRTQMSQGNVDLLMDLWAASLLRFGGEPPFANVKHMHELIDSTPLGDAPWTTMEASYTGELPANPPSWMTAKYELCFRDPRVCARNMLANPDFAKEFDTTPYREYDGRMVRQYCNLLSGDWAWEQAVCHGVSFSITVRLIEADY